MVPFCQKMMSSVRNLPAATLRSQAKKTFNIKSLKSLEIEL